MAGFFEELKRRNVLKVAVAYIVTAWLIVQVLDAVVPMLLLPDWVGRAILLLLIVGFPIALVLAWAFELTSEGIKLDHEVRATETAPRDSGRRIDFVIIGLLVVAVGYFAVDKFFLRTGGSQPVIEESGVASIAVLPFVNMSDNRENEYFADGLTEELLNLLAKRTDLRVAARTSSFQFKDHAGDVQDIGRQLKVDHIIEGSVRRAGDHIRVTAQLIDVNDGYHRWSESYDGELEDIFAVQDEISEAIASALHSKLSGSGVATRSTENLEAYGLYMQGRHYWRQRKAEGLQRAIELFEAAIELDPGFARAHEGLAAAYGVFPFWDDVPEERYFEAAAAAANRALELNDQLAEAWALRAYIEEFRGNWIEAARLKRRALAVDPENAMANVWYAELLNWMGRSEEAIPFYRIAYELDPMAPVVNGLIVLSYNVIQDYDNAMKHARIASEVGHGTRYIGYVYEEMGDWERAAEFYRLDSRIPDWYVVCMQHAHAPDVYPPPTDVPESRLGARCFELLDRNDAAFRVVAASIRSKGMGDSTYWNFWRPGSTLVEHPDFPALAEEIGLLAYWQANGFPSNCQPEGNSVRCAAR